MFIHKNYYIASLKNKEKICKTFSDKRLRNNYFLMKYVFVITILNLFCVYDIRN